MHQPPGFTDSAHSDYVCHLQKSLYGLKQATRAWFQLFSSYAIRAGFYHSKIDSYLFIFHKGPETAYLLLYVEDIILTASSTSLLQCIISSLHAEFAMTDLGPLNYFLEPHLNAMKRVLRGTTDLVLQLFRSTTSQLTAYADADWAGCSVTRRSTSGYCVFLDDNLLAWSSKHQDTLSRSSAEAEYRGVANVVAETFWIRNLLRELHTPLFPATLVYCDNVSAVYMSANPMQHQRTKHIEIDIHFVRDKVAAGHVRVLHVPSRFQYADIFTKGLPYPLFTDFRSSLSVRTTCFCDMQEEEFCLVSGLKFDVENSTDYNKAKDPIPFRRRVFSSNLDGRPIRGNDVLLLIESDMFKRLDNNDAVSLCCVGILQLVLLGVQDRRPVPNWILRLTNDRVSWDNYHWGSYVCPTLYKHLRDANVKCWQPLYASEPANETDTKSYSIEGFAWAFKTWILESFRAATDDYYTRYRRHPRIVAWSSKHKFYRNILKQMLHVRATTCSGYVILKEKNADMYEKLTRFMEDMRRVPEAHTTPIIADQHFGVSDMSGFQSYQGAPSAFNTLANNSSFFNMPTTSNLQTPNQSNWLSPSNWQTPNQSYLDTPNSQPPIPSQPSTSN
nr:ribonuclease H-like domain-containing protein [Tanacetum cinerariifolium]